MNGLKGEKGDPADIGGMLGLRVSAAGLAQGGVVGGEGTERLAGGLCPSSNGHTHA